MATSDIAPLIASLTALAGAILPSIGLGVWIMRQFANQDKRFYQALETQRLAFEKKVDDHEKVDQGRHKDNLRELSELGNGMTRLETILEYAGPKPKR